VIESLTRIRSHAGLLGSAHRGKARLLMDRIMAAPRPVYVGAAAVAFAIWGNAFLLQIGHPAPPLAPPAQESLPVSANLAAPRAYAAPASPAPVAPAAASPAPVAPAAAVSRASQASAPDTTSSIARAGQEEPRQTSAPPAPLAPNPGEGKAAARGPDPIGDLLRGKPVDEGSRLVRAAQIALAKLGYAVKLDGADDGATRRALRHFARKHGLAPTTEINPELVKRLTAAARAGG
jgi:Putative peptidoglycan binding domain